MDGEGGSSVSKQGTFMKDYFFNNEGGDGGEGRAVGRRWTIWVKIKEDPLDGAIELLG